MTQILSTFTRLPLVASGRKRRNQIVSLRDNDKEWTSLEDSALKFYEFFLNLFGKRSKTVISMNWSLILGEESIELSDLIRDFTLDEIKHTMFSFKGNKAPDLDGFLFSFFRDIGQLLGRICWCC